MTNPNAKRLLIEERAFNEGIMAAARLFEPSDDPAMTKLEALKNEARRQSILSLLRLEHNIGVTPRSVPVVMPRALVDFIWEELCEIPDRSSPEDQPDMALVCLNDLLVIAEDWNERQALVQPQSTQPVLATTEPVEILARALCQIDGVAPDSDAPRQLVCGHYGEVLPNWEAYREKAEGFLREWDKLTYKSTQSTLCPCGQTKHTPLRRDEMGGYVCLTCIDRRLNEAVAAEQRTQKLEGLVEQAFRDGLAYGSNVQRADPDLAWQQARIRDALKEHQ